MLPNAVTMDTEDLHKFLDKQRDLLEKAHQAEIHSFNEAIAKTNPKTLCARGLACLNLNISRYYTGLGGKSIVELTVDSSVSTSGEIPANGLKTGDIIRLGEQVSGTTKAQSKRNLPDLDITGVIIKVTRQKIAIALNNVEKSHEIPASTKRMWLVKIANDATLKRMIRTIDDLKDTTPDMLSSIARISFGLTKYTKSREKNPSFEYLDEGLNECQKLAVSFAIQAENIALIHGPPGTGKTHTLIEIIRQLVSTGSKILVCGPSNISVDNIADKLAHFRIPMIRLGHPARLLPTVLSSSLDIAIQDSDAGMLVKDIRKEMDEKSLSLKKVRTVTERKKCWAEIRELRRECKEREKRCTHELLKTSKVVLSTLHGTGSQLVRMEVFDVVIIDEAGQALEAQTWIPLTKAPKCILAGDHLQLGPNIPRSEDDFRDLELSLFERLIKLHGPAIKKTLTRQYRMHDTIMRYPSNAQYDSSLVADASVQCHLLSDISGVKKTDDTREPLVYWDTQGGYFRETFLDGTGLDSLPKKTYQSESKSNSMEAALCNLHLRNLVNAGVRPGDIGIITPYNAQVSILSDLVKREFPEVEIGSVDGFQGREKEAIILSLVRSNENHEVGFLADDRRLNVAITRPRRHLCVVGDSETITSGSKFLKDWVEFLEEYADLRYPDPSWF